MCEVSIEYTVQNGIPDANNASANNMLNIPVGNSTGSLKCKSVYSNSEFHRDRGSLDPRLSTL